MTDVKVEVKTLDDLQPDPNNANRHSVRGHTLVENSLRKRGAFRSVAAAGKGVDKPVVMAGNLTIEKARDAGFEEVVFVHTSGKQIVAVIRDDIEPGSAEAIALGLEDNESAKQSYSPDLDIVAALAAGDNAILSALKQEDKVFGSMLEGMGLKDETKDAPVDVDRAAELLEKWQVKAGDLWRIGEHRLICGDCTDAATVGRVMGGERADLVLTDPPYSVDYAAKNRALQTIGRSNRLTTDIEGDTLSTEETAEQIWSPAFENAYNVSRNGTVIYCFAPQGGDQMMMMMMMRAKWNDRLHQLIWRKNSPTFAMGRLDYQYQHEPILYTWKGTNHGFYSEAGRSVIDCDRPSASKLHPTMRPVELFEVFIRNSSKDGEIIYEPFSGSGTTLVACENLSRRCRAIEISPAYVAVALERMSQAFPALEIRKL